MKISPSALDELVAYIGGRRPGFGPDRRIEVQIVPELLHSDATPEVKSPEARRHQGPRQPNPMVQTRAMKLIGLLLEHKGIDAETVRDFITHVAEAAAWSSASLLERLEGVVAAVNLRRDVEWIQTADVGRIWLSPASTARLSKIWAAVQERPGLQSELEYTVDAIIAREASSDPDAGVASSDEGLLAVTRACFDRAVRLLEEGTGLPQEDIEKTIGDVADRALLSARELRWLLLPGDMKPLYSPARGESPPDSDSAWTLLARFALAVLPVLPYPGEEGEDGDDEDAQALQRKFVVLHGGAIHREHSYFKTLTMLRRVEQFSELSVDFGPFSPESKPDWPEAVRGIIGTQIAKVDSDLLVQLAAAIARQEGRFSWQTCLRLANGRSHFVRYMDADDDTRWSRFGGWHLQLAVRRSTDVSWEITHIVAEQPLPTRFRSHFEAQNLAGQVAVLESLIDTANRAGRETRNVNETEVLRLVHLREDELWARMLSQTEGNA